MYKFISCSQFVQAYACVFSNKLHKNVKICIPSKLIFIMCCLFLLFRCRIVSGGISILRQQAMAMGEELEEQNETLDRMGDKTDLNIKRVQNASARTAALL